MEVRQMDLSRLTSKAKEIFARRGGAEAAKKDAQELKDIARSDASLSEKAKKGFEALKEPGARGKEQRPAGEEQRPAGEQQRPAGEQQRPAGEEQQPAGEQQRPAGGEQQPRP
jgi:hypothetical protein